MDKVCGVCGEVKPAEDFNWRRRSMAQRDSMCRPCRALYKQEHYRSNRQRYIDNARARTARVVEERTRFVVGYLRSHPCVDCGETDVLVLEFDHLREKSFNVSAGLRGGCSLEALFEEMAKCEVVCANCHRRRTARRGGFMRFLVSEPESVEGAGAEAVPSPRHTRV
jgi:hypothetical protein